MCLQKTNFADWKKKKEYLEGNLEVLLIKGVILGRSRMKREERKFSSLVGAVETGKLN